MEPYWKKAHDPTLKRRQKLIRGARARAKARGLEFTIDVDDIPIPDVCPILGVPFHLETKPGRYVMNRHVPSIDRVDSTKGYIPGNVKVITWWANYLKEQLTLKQAIALVDYMGGEV